MKTIQNAAASTFISSVAVLSIIAILGVWDIFGKDIINKSFQTLGLLTLVAIIVMIAGRFLEGRQAIEGVASDLPSPIYKDIRRITLTILIVCVSLLALLGVLAIWEIIQDKDVLYKSLGSLGILAFGAFIIVMVCLYREGKFNKQNKSLSIGGIVGIMFLAYLLFSFSRMFW